MDRKQIKKMDARIKAIKKAAQELKELSSGIPAVNRNTERILASVKMLEINISDVIDHNPSQAHCHRSVVIQVHGLR